MINFFMNVVDANDVWFSIRIDAPSLQKALVKWDTMSESQYSILVNVEEILDDGTRQLVWSSDDFNGDPDYGDRMSDVEADADTLRNAGWGTDEDYFSYGDEY